ncbi:MAG: hypothetical protein KDD58_03305 [Bdellovibrionales bacterium]|nr:hypothetical protein [Bdellovibrionales bacterium]
MYLLRLLTVSVLLLISTSGLTAQLNRNEDDKVEIINFLNDTYLSLNKTNISKYLVDWDKKVKKYLCADEPECNVSYILKLNTENNSEYLLVPQLASILADDKNTIEISFSLSRIKDLPLVKKVDSNILKFDTFSEPVIYDKYLEIKDLNAAEFITPRDIDQFIDFYENKILTEFNSLNTFKVTTNDQSSSNLIDGETVYSAMIENSYLQDLSCKDMIVKLLDTEGMEIESPYIYIENGIVYQLINKIYSSEVVNSQCINSKGTFVLSINSLDEKDAKNIQTIDFPYDIKNDLHGIYKIQRVYDKISPYIFNLSKVDFNNNLMNLEYSVLKNHKNDYTRVIRRSYIDICKMAEAFKLFSHVNVFSLEMFPINRGYICLSYGHSVVEKLTIHNFSGIPITQNNQIAFSNVDRNILNLPKLKEIEFPFFLAKDYPSIQNFRNGISNSDYVKKYEEDNSLHTAFKKPNSDSTYNIKTSLIFKSEAAYTITENDITSEYTSPGNEGKQVYSITPANGLPFEAIRMLRNNKDYKLKVVLAVDNTSDEKQLRDVRGIDFFEVRMLCKQNPNGDLLTKFSSTKLDKQSAGEQIFKRLRNNLFEAELDISPLVKCNTYDENNFTITVQVNVVKSSPIQLKYFDWYLQGADI